MKVRLAVPEAIAAEGIRVRHILETAGVTVTIVAAEAESDLALRAGEGTLGIPSVLDTIVIGLPEPRDALVAVRSATLDEVPEEGVVGLSGTLRREMLGVHRPDLRTVEIEDSAAVGDLLQAGEIDAWIAPIQAVRQAGLADRAGEVFEPTSWATGAGRGVLVLTIEHAPHSVRAALKQHENGGARAALTAELATLDAMGAGRAGRIGVMARPHGRLLRVRALVPAAEGGRLVRAEISGTQDDPHDAGRRTAKQLLDRGAADLIGAGSAG